MHRETSRSERRPDSQRAKKTYAQLGPGQHRLWTTQSLKRWQRLECTGVLRGTVASAYPDFRESYAWMRAQMTSQLGPPPKPDTSPIWAWYQYDGVAQIEPDFPDLVHEARQGEVVAAIEFTVTEPEVLLSDYELWHFVLGRWVFPGEVGVPRDAGGRSEAEKFEGSWPKIFDLDWVGDEYDVPRSEKSIQACVWELRASQVLRVDHWIRKGERFWKIPKRR